MCAKPRGLTLSKKYLKMDCRAKHKIKCTNPEYIELGVDILDITQKAYSVKEILPTVDFVEIKNFCPMKML